MFKRLDQMGEDFASWLAGALLSVAATTWKRTAR
jgi:hypothetical protein